MTSFMPYGFLTAGLLSLAVYGVVRAGLALYAYLWRLNKLSLLPGGRGHWLLGALAEFPGPGEAGLKEMLRSNEIFPKIAHFYLGPFQVTVNVTHPETAKYVLKTAEPKPLNPGSAYFNALPWLGEGLLLSRGRKWARNRRLITPAFHFDILKPYILVNNRATDILIERICETSKNEEYFEVFSHISMCTLDVILKCAFSFQEDVQRHGADYPYVRALQQILHTMVYRFLRPWLYSDFMFYLSPTGREFKRSCALVHATSSNVIKQRKQALAESSSDLLKDRKYLDFLDILLTARDDSGQGLTDKEIRDEVDTFLFEGHDTTASGISWTLYCLAQNPDWQRKCQEEVDEILQGRDSDDILWEDLAQLKTLSLCIKEGLRMHSTVPFIQRELTKDMYIDGYFVPAGTMVNVHLYLVMHNQTVWDEPMKFKPDRFLGENSEKLHAYANIPFSAGPRNCIGQNFAMHEMKSIIARIVRKFDLYPDPARRARPEIVAVMKTEDGMYMKAVPRAVAHSAGFDLYPDPARRARPEMVAVMKTEDGMYMKAVPRTVVHTAG